MPIIDLHRHLEGSIRPSTALALAHKHQHWLAAESRPLDHLVAPVRTAGLLDYLERIDVACSTARAIEDWSLIAQQSVQDCFDEGLDYAEIRFSPWFIHTQTGLDPTEVIDAIIDAARDASALLKLPVAFIGIVVRDLGPDVAIQQMNTILSRSGRFCGVDLAGDEAGYPPTLFAPAFARARDAGLRVTAHAGEAAGPDSVRAALQALRPDRIGHGVRAAEDPRLMEQLADARITLEVALTSNVQTRAAASLREHPIRRLIQAGVPVSLNTDNPTPSATDVAAEYRRAATEVGLSKAELQLIARDSAAAAFTEAGRQVASTPSAADN